MKILLVLSRLETEILCRLIRQEFDKEDTDIDRCIELTALANKFRLPQKFIDELFSDIEAEIFSKELTKEVLNIN